MANEHIKDYLKWYLSDSCNSPKFAVLIKGGWGSGKTYFIKQFIKEQEDIDLKLADSTKKSFLYISLYGLSSTAEIDDQIFQQLHPFLASKGVAIAGKIAKGLLNFGLKINLDDKGTAEASATPAIPDVSIKSLLNKFKSKILVFDDLERSNMLIQNVLGYINAFVEHQDAKVIIIANDDEIEEGLDLTNKSVDSKYHRIKEKVIGKTFVIEADNDIVINALIQECANFSQIFLVKQQSLCLDIFNTVEKGTGQKNFRAFSHTLRDFEYLWPTIDMKYSSHPELMNLFLNIFIRFSYELQLSNITEDDIRNIESWRLSNVLKRTRGTSLSDNASDKKVDRLGNFFSRHAPFDAYNMVILTYELWYKLICKCNNISKEINEALSSSHYFVNERTPEWQKLWHHLTIDDENIPALMDQVAYKISDHEYMHPGVVLHVFGLFMWLRSLGYELPAPIGKSVLSILRNGKAYIDWLGLNHKLPIDDKIFSSIDMSTGCFGLGFAGNDINEFKQLWAYYERKTNEANRLALLLSAPDVLLLMHQNPPEFYSVIGNPHLRGSRYWNVPVFSSITPQDFWANFMKVPNKHKSYILDAISERYKWLNNSDGSHKLQMKDLINETQFWTRLQKLISGKLKRQKVSPSLVWAKRFDSETIKKAIQELTTFANSFGQTDNTKTMINQTRGAVKKEDQPK
jgi:hypothetical protein